MGVTRFLTGLLLAVAGSASPMAAQMVQGRVLEVDGTRPVSGADVVLLSGDGGAVAVASSDSTGFFRLRAPGPGDYGLRVERLGYQGYTTEPLRLERGEIVQVELRLDPRAIPVEPVIVTARTRPESRFLEEFEARREDPAQAGYYVTREEVERRPVATPTQLIQGLPNVRITPAITGTDAFSDVRLILLPNPRVISGARDCVANVFVDGIWVQQSPTSTIDDILSPETIAGIEVYPRPAMVPMAYRRDADCGAVLFWTAPGEPSQGGWGLKRILVGTGGLLLLVLVGLG